MEQIDLEKKLDDVCYETRIATAISILNLISTLVLNFLVLLSLYLKHTT